MGFTTARSLVSGKLVGSQLRTNNQLNANSRFNRFAPEVHQLVRQADTQSQSYIEKARRTREMLRGMTVDQLLQVIEFKRDLTFFQALELAKQGYLIVPNDIHDIILTEMLDQKLLLKLYSNGKWTGTLVIYEKPDEPFGENVTFRWQD